MSEQERCLTGGAAETVDLGACRPQTTDDGTIAQPRPPRLRTVDRQQILPAITLDQLIETDHPARAVWTFVTGLDLAILYRGIRSRVGGPGRSAIDPRILVAVWLYAFLAGYTSAREVARLCHQHNAFRWLVGGVSVNHHTLSDFLVDHLDFLEQLFEYSVAVLHREGLVDLERVAQDGVRVRASAGAASFRRRPTLETLRQAAEREVLLPRQPLVAVAEGAQAASEGAAEVGEGEDVTADELEPGSVDKEPSAGQRGARRRAAAERLERLGQALKRMPEMEAKKTATEQHKARVSTTDPAATVMKMGDGGYRPAYNIQFSTTCSRQIIVGVDVVTVGSDQGQLPPMLDQIEARFGVRPQAALVDGGFANHEDIDSVQQGSGAAGGCVVYAPVPQPKKAEVDRYAAHAGDSVAVVEWRQRMSTAVAKEIYKERAATAECVNAQARNRGLVLLLVRGWAKVKAVALWFATVHNMARGFALLPRPVMNQ